jgi:hypothetical protein
LIDAILSGLPTLVPPNFITFITDSLQGILNLKIERAKLFECEKLSKKNSEVHHFGTFKADLFSLEYFLTQ